MANAASDCNGDWEGTNPSCHTMGDNGGDFFESGRGGLGYNTNNWEVPNEDLALIY